MRDWQRQADKIEERLAMAKARFGVVVD